MTLPGLKFLPFLPSSPSLHVFQADLEFTWNKSCVTRAPLLHNKLRPSLCIEVQQPKTYSGIRPTLLDPFSALVSSADCYIKLMQGSILGRAIKAYYWHYKILSIFCNTMPCSLGARALCSHTAAPWEQRMGMIWGFWQEATTLRRS